jgi:hypothetical protein
LWEPTASIRTAVDRWIGVLHHRLSTREHRHVDAHDELASRVVRLIGARAARELLDVLNRSEEERAALIGRLTLRADGATVAELLMDLEEDEIARLHFMEALRRIDVD